jgi:hypothetical protein
VQRLIRVSVGSAFSNAELTCLQKRRSAEGYLSRRVPPTWMSSSKSPDWHSCLFGHRSEDGRVDRNMQVGRQSRQGGPSLALTAWICIGLLFGGLALGVALGGMMPLPYGPVAAVQRYVRAQPVAVQVMAVAVFGSSVPLAIYAATVSARLWQLGATAPGATIALAGGILAAGTLGLTGLVGWTLSRPEISGDTALVRALYFLVFLVGGPGHIVALGLLVAAWRRPASFSGCCRDCWPGSGWRSPLFRN